MHFESPGAILVHLGPIVIRWYGLLIALGFLAATVVTTHWGPKEGIPREKLVTGSLIGFIGGVIGGRLYFVACSWPYFAEHPLKILATWEGGMSIHGGIIGGFAAGLAYAYFVGMPVLRCMDIGGCGTVLAQAIGRWGNFFNSEAFGRPVGGDFLLKLFIPPNHRPVEVAQFSYFHPTFLYESAINRAIFLFLYFYLLNNLKNYPGVCFFVYLAIYSIGRLLIEPLRLDSIMTSNNIPIPIIASAVELLASTLIIVGLVLYHNNRRPRVALIDPVDKYNHQVNLENNHQYQELESHK
jgi:phosphatidylglycerol---prolipoprotein diacylglyceryl transferase